MASFSVSPSVDIIEKDLTLFTRTLVSYSGAISGAFQWGPVGERTYVTNGVEELVQRFGKPDDTVAEHFFCAASFLAYRLPLYVTRVLGSSGLSLNATKSGGTGVLIKNEEDYFDGTTYTGNPVIAKYPGTMGNGLIIETCPSGNFSSWAYKAQFEYAPDATKNEIHVVIVDSTGNFGEVGAILEKFAHCQDTKGARQSDGSNAYFFDVLNSQSRYMWAGATADITSTLFPASVNSITLANGIDDNTTPDLADGYALYTDSDQVEVAFLIAGAANNTEAGVLIDIATARKDCMAFVSPNKSDVVNQPTLELSNVLDFRNIGAANKNTSYAVMDCNWKYTYDRYNDTNRWIPCCGDVAGLTGRVYSNNEPWESPAGYDHGQMLGVIKLAWNPDKSQRDELYTAQINPVISAKGLGHVLFGDKTMLTAPSAFGYINVRSLFILVEKSIADAAKYQLFKLNNASTRSIFRNTTRQFLRNIQSRGGIMQFQVIADETNNTEQVINEGRFIGSISIKPSRTINNILLEFSAIDFSVDFEETETA